MHTACGAIVCPVPANQLVTSSDGAILQVIIGIAEIVKIVQQTVDKTFHSFVEYVCIACRCSAAVATWTLLCMASGDSLRTVRPFGA